GGSATVSRARRRGGAREDRKMHCDFGKRHAFARELSQRRDWKVPARYAHAARGPKADAAHARCRSAPGTTEGKESRHSVRKIVASHCRWARETRADNFIFDPTGVSHLAALQQLR